MEKASKTTKAILKLSKDTIDGNVKWSIGTKHRVVLPGEEEVGDNIYIAEYHGKSLRLYRYRYKDYYDYMEYNWVNSYRLEMIDRDQNSLWEFPSDNAIIGLYDTVREETSDVKSFLDDIIGNE